MHSEELSQFRGDDASVGGEGIPSLILIGFPRVGKTFYGKKVADALGWQFRDVDEEIARAAGLSNQSKREVYALLGEVAFRDKESEVVQKRWIRDPFVLATGGGTVCQEENREVLRKAGRVVFLSLPKKTLQERVLAPPRSAIIPSLSVWESLYVQRLPLYRKAAHYVVDLEGKTDEEILSRLVEYATASIY